MLCLRHTKTQDGLKRTRKGPRRESEVSPRPSRSQEVSEYWYKVITFTATD